MSEAILRRAVRNALLADQTLGLRQQECALTLGPQPNAGVPGLFVAIHEGGWKDDSEDNYHYEILGVDVTVSIQPNGWPRDRWGDKAAETISEGFSSYCRRIVKLIHRSYTVLTAANALIDSSEDYHFTKPLVFRDGGRPLPRTSAWFGGIDKDDRPAGFSRTLSFEDALRVQTIEDYQ